MLRYLGILIVISIVGLLGWTFGSYKDKQLWKDKWPQCSMDGLWSIMWACFEMIVLILGMRFCYKARSSHWTERNQFTAAVCIEAIITFICTVIKYSYKDYGSRDIMLLITFIQVFVAITLNIFIIITPKFVTVCFCFLVSVFTRTMGKLGILKLCNTKILTYPNFPV